MIDQPALLERSIVKSRRWGGGRSSCQKIGPSLFGVCLFFGGFWPFEKLGLPLPKKYIGGTTWDGPPTLAAPDDFTIHGHDASVEVSRHTAAGVVRRGHDGYSPLNTDGGSCSGRPREMDRGWHLMTVAVGVAAAAGGGSASSGCG